MNKMIRTSVKSSSSDKNGPLNVDRRRFLARSGTVLISSTLPTSGFISFNVFATIDAQQVTLSTENFEEDINAWSWQTPGLIQPSQAWSRQTASTPSQSTGPDGGANSVTGAVEAGNAYAYTEASETTGPYTLESPEFDASQGILSLSFQVHMRFGSVGGITDGSLEIQGWNGSSWIGIGPAIVGSQQGTADSAYLHSSEFGDYDSRDFSNPDFRFRFLATKGNSEFLANYDMAIDNVVIIGPDGSDDPNSVTLNVEQFQNAIDSWTWQTPGLTQSAQAWSRETAGTPSQSAGPNGGANPLTGDIEVGNAYAYTEASGSTGPYSLESPVFDASAGPLYLTFHVHMRFGSIGGISDGTLEVQGWDGENWIDLGPQITGSQQGSPDNPYLPSSTFGEYTSLGFSNPDFKFRFLATKGDSEFSANYDFAIDNVRIVGPRDAQREPPPPTDLGFNTGLRRLHVSSSGQAPLDGSLPDQTFTDLQTAFNALQPGDVLTIASGTYTGSFAIANKAGTAQDPIWVCAEERGRVILSNLVQNIKNGTASWRNDGNGVFSIAGSRPYVGWDITTGDFLPGYRNVADINSTSIPTVLGPNNPSGSINKPQRGFGFANGRISLKLRDGANPNGRPIALTNGFAQGQLDLNNADHLIIDGLVFEGAGDSQAVQCRDNCANPTIRNCVFEGTQFGVRAAANNTLIDWCEYLQTGFKAFQKELRQLNGNTVNAIFGYAKNYYTASIVGGNDGDALLEGGIDVAVFNGTPAFGVTIQHCYIHSVFEGSKAGRHRNAVVKNCVFESCLDDAVEFESEPFATPTGQSEFHDNLVKNCFSAVSYQGNMHVTNHYCYRNIFLNEDLEVAHPPFMLKTIRTEPAANLHFYHNLMINPAVEGNDGFSTNHWVWFGFSNSTAGRIGNFFNNIVMFANDLDLPNQGVDQRPKGRSNNAVVSPANNAASAEVQGGNGVFAGNSEADMKLNTNFTLQSDSPARNAGKSLPSGFPDTGLSNIDAGVFPFGFDPGPNWPRPENRFFSTALPSRWTSPGV